MTALKRVTGQARELWRFLRVRKRWWLLPVLVALFGLGLFVVLTEGSAAVPFIYTIF